LRWVVAIIPVIAGLGSGFSREEISLNGRWEFQNVLDLAYPPSGNWLVTTVPRYLWGYGDKKAWFRKTFLPPRSMSGMKIKLRFGAVKYDSKVYLNGVFVGGHLSGYDPFELDITSHVRLGEQNELLVGTSDCGALVSTPFNSSNVGAAASAPDRATNGLIAPIGGRYQVYGIPGDVTLRGVPEFFIEDVFVITSVREKKITVRVRLRNEGMTEKSGILASSILEGEAPLLALPVTGVTVPPDGMLDVEVEAQWLDARVWCPSDPHLYSLETVLEPSTGFSDKARVRFGFREFWCEWDSFYLNGTKIHLSGTSAWPNEVFLSKEAIRKVYENVKAANTNTFRLHTQPWLEPWYDVADEVGMLIVEEGAVWGRYNEYRVADPAFWSNFADHLRGMVSRDRNHPSVILWSLENELLYSNWGRVPSGETEQELGKLGRMVKELDPTRPIMYEGDIDPGGAADVVNIHYPHEFPSYYLWPETAYWMDEPTSLEQFPKMKWQWDRKKPLYLGEFLWMGGPFTYGDEYYPSIVYGDEIYADTLPYRNKAKGWIWQMQIEAFRDYDVSGIGPYSIFRDVAVEWGTLDLKPDQNHLHQVQKAAFHPNAVFVKEYNTRFFVGERVERSLRVYNDTMRRGEFLVKWTAGDVGGTRTLSLEPSSRRGETIAFNVPEAPGNFVFRVELLEGLTTVFSEERVCSAHPQPRLSLPGGRRLALYDVNGATATLFAGQGVECLRIARLSEAPYDQFDILIIGSHSLKEEGLPALDAEAIAAKWEGFFNRGGWIVVLEQSWYPEWMPPGLPTPTWSVNFAFPRALAHPIIHGLSPADLRWWRDDNRVTAGNFLKPSVGNYRILVDVGSRIGMDRGVMVEFPRGRGGYICSQMLLVSKFTSEPIAGILFQRILDYCCGSTRPLRHSGLVAEPDSDAAKTFSELGLLSENLLGRLATCDLSAYPLVIVAGGEAAWTEATACLGKLVSYVENGGRLMLHRPSEGFLSEAQRTLLSSLEADSSVTLPILRDMHNEVASSVSNYELYWVETPGVSTKPPVLSQGIAGRVFRLREGVTPSPEREVFLTKPGVLVRVNRGRGFALLDEIAWETEEKNREKARRIISTVLTDLGAVFTGPLAGLPKIVGLALNEQTGASTLVWQGKQDGVYTVECLSDLMGEPWRPVGNVVGGGMVVSWVDDGAATGIPPGDVLARQRFYRLKALAD
jgi:beta-galactosidase